jgi:hypothetical protein
MHLLLAVRALEGLAAVKPLDVPECPRRRVWFRTLALGIFSAAGEAAARSIPDAPLSEFSLGQQIQHLSGLVLVNGCPATLTTSIVPGDIVETSNDAEVTFVVASEKFVLRGGSRAVVGVPVRSPLKKVLREISGSIASSNSQQQRIAVSTSTAGIRA